MVRDEVGELRKVSDMPPKDRCPDGHPELQCNFDGTNNDAVAKHGEKCGARDPRRGADFGQPYHKSLQVLVQNRKLTAIAEPNA